MECDICFEKFDHSLNKPVALIRCLHTICSACLKRLKEKKCPTCNRPIEDSETNWHLLKHVAESEYDKFKLEVIKYSKKSGIDDGLAIEFYSNTSYNFSQIHIYIHNHTHILSRLNEMRMRRKYAHMSNKKNTYN